MISAVRRGFALLLAVGSVALFQTSCAKNESSLFIKGCQVVAPDTCEANADPAAASNSQGTLDVAFRKQYFCAALIGNQVVSRGNSTTLRTETSRVEIYEATISVLYPDGSVVVRGDGSAAQFDVPTTGFVDVGLAGQPGYGLAGIELIDQATGQDLASQLGPMHGKEDLVVSIVARGRTLGGNELETTEFLYPITVCYGCLCQTPPGVDCQSMTDSPDANCEIGQDIPVDCRYATATAGKCP